VRIVGDDTTRKHADTEHGAVCGDVADRTVQGVGDRGPVFCACA
jgi:hypothetical protein